MRQVKPAPTHDIIDRVELESLCLMTISPGDAVKVSAEEHKRNGFLGKVQGIYQYPDGHIEVDVFGGRGGKAGWKTLSPDRLTRQEEVE